MRKIISGFAVSLDGYIEGPNGEYDWILIDPEIDFVAEMKRYDAFFLGRVSYEKMFGMNAPAAKGITNYVFSNSLKKAENDYVLITGEIKEQVEELKKRKGKDIAVWGGASLLSSLLDLKVVDELSVSIIPVLLGKGKPMVDVLSQKVNLHLLKTKTYSNGTVNLTYEVRY